MSIESTLRKAAKLAKQGNRAGAAALYNEVLAKFPNNIHARKGLAALQSPGQVSPKAQAAGRTPHPTPPPQQMQALQQLHARGAYAKVISECQRLQLLYPNSPAVLNMLGLSFSGVGRLEEAVTAFERVHKIDPAFAGSLLNMSNALIKLGRYEELGNAARKLLALDPNNAYGRMFLGYALVHSGQPVPAEAEFRQAIRLAPGEQKAHIGLGISLAAMKRAEDALAAFEKAREIAPTSPEVLNNIGNALVGLDRFEEAIETFQKALELHPKYDPLRENYVRALRDLGLYDDALEQARIIQKNAPDNAMGWALAGTSLRELGDFEGAREALTRATEIDPNNADTVSALWLTKTLPIDDPEFERIEAWAASSKTDPGSVPVLEYTLFSALDKAGKPERAFPHLERANRVRRELEPYNIARQGERFEAVRRMFSQAPRTLETDDIADIPAPYRPIFIVGMPRSGTSLVEQILASHSLVHGAGELAGIDRAMAGAGWKSEDIGEEPTRDMLRAFRRAYFDFTTRLDIDKPVFTDKAPLNFRWIGFALAAMPEARVLVMRRDARATCWSNYSHMFTGRANNFGCDMVDTARMYHMHLEMTDFWLSVFPDRAAIVPYEALTENQELETRKILAAAGLEWEDACLEFHKTRRAVRTSSFVQVRKKMYKGSSEAWRSYEPFLGPMLELLADV